MTRHETIVVRTRGRGTIEVTQEIERVLGASALNNGLCHLFLQHTSASLILCENADPSVRIDLETILARLAPDGDRAYAHDTEGPDDMAAHARSVLTSNSLSIPFAEGRLLLGTWQGVFLWEHRRAPHARRIVVTLMGD